MQSIETIRHIAEQNGYDMKEPPEHISVSQIRNWSNCQWSWAFRYLTAIPAVMPRRVLIGTLVHNGMQKLGEARRDGKDINTVPLEALIVDDDIKLQNYDMEGVSIESTITDAIVIIRKAKPVIQQLEPPALFEHTIAGHFLGDHELKGYVDYIADDGTIYDYKCGSRHKTQKDVDSDLQLSLYAWAVNGNDCKVGFVSISSKDGNYKVMKSYRTSAQMDAAAKIMTYSSHAITNSCENGNFVPNNDGWWCSSSCCSYHNLCPFGGALNVNNW